MKLHEKHLSQSSLCFYFLFHYVKCFSVHLSLKLIFHPISAFTSYAIVFPSAFEDKKLTWLFLNNSCSQ